MTEQAPSREEIDLLEIRAAFDCESVATKNIALRRAFDLLRKYQALISTPPQTAGEERCAQIADEMFNHYATKHLDCLSSGDTEKLAPVWSIGMASASKIATAIRALSTAAYPSPRDDFSRDPFAPADAGQTEGRFKCNCPYEVRHGCNVPECPHYVWRGQTTPAPTPASAEGALRLLQASTCWPRGSVCAALPCACAESLASPPAPQAQGEQLVPKEPIEAMLEAALDESGNRILPYVAPRESGVPVECDMSDEDAREINEALKASIADTYRAMLAASPQRKG